MLLELGKRSVYHEAHGLGAMTRPEAEARLREAITARVAAQAAVGRGAGSPEDVRLAINAEQSAQRALAEAIEPGALARAAAGADLAAAARAIEAAGGSSRSRFASGPAALEIDLPIVGRVPGWAKVAAGIGLAVVIGMGARRALRRRSARGRSRRRRRR